MNCKEMNFNKNTVFLVTGGAGFIGSNLCESILEMGYRVRCFDNFIKGKYENVKHLLSNPAFELIKSDIRNYDACLSACRNVDFVLHHAALGSVPESMKDPLSYEEVNVKGTLNMMEAARQQNVKKFIYASSAAVYGDDSILPKKEKNIGKALSPYALTKQINEQYGKLYADLYKLDTYGLRYFNVFGKRQDSNGMYASVIPKFIEQLLNNEQPVIYGDGMQSRDFVYIDDVVKANLMACAASPETAGQVYNIASGEKRNLLDVYNYLRKRLKKNTEPFFAIERNGEIKHSWADIGKAMKQLGYKPEWNFERGISELTTFGDSVEVSTSRY